MKPLFLILILLAAQLLTNGQSWKGLRPISSVRSDVEQTLGHSSRVIAESIRYDSSDAIVFVLYADGKCDRSTDIEWNLREGTVVAINVVPKDYVSPGSLGYDLTQFVKSKGPKDLPNVWWYINDKEGVFITIDETSTFGSDAISRLMLVPHSSERHLQCPEDKRGQPLSNP